MTLYLKYRPTDFESLVWQDFIKNTLRQAILKDKLVWAYLFCWPRWTWKTSTARIFAKAINCTNLKDGNPCLKCEICRWFNDDSLVDIIEIDAASYTWVDNIREIIERASFSPTNCKYKVYIIDEVHMLSKWAFNALLKILEEPPKHLKFILATTESHKIPETILSRCQRYDFKSITWEDLKNRLLYISKNENIKIDDESLDFIIKQSNWWLRNAISLFEQLNFNWEIIFENVINNYWIPKNEVIINFYHKLFNKDISVIDDFENNIKNYNLNLFFKELLFYIKDELIKNILDEKIVSRNIFLLDTLEESYLKSKNSFDGKTTFLVWIIKCVKNITTEFQEKKIEKVQIKEIKKEEKKSVENDYNHSEKIEEISTDDLFDVFGEDNNSKETKISNNTSNNNIKKSTFDIESFIAELKKLGSKWALTMSLRWSSLQYDEKNLTIYTKTKIALKQIALAENISLMNNALQNMWLLNINIEVK